MECVRPTLSAEPKGNCATTTESARCSDRVSAAAVSLTLRLCVGAFGEVRMCVKRDTGDQRAVKVLRKSHMDEDEKRMLFNEINILKDIVSARALFQIFNYNKPD